MKEKNKNYLAGFGLLLAAFIWGFAFVVVKNSLDFIPTAYMLAFRFTIASIGLAIIFHKKLRKINKKAVKSSIVLGLLLVFSYYTQTLGCQYTTAGKNAFLTTIYVIIVPFLYWIFGKKRPDKFVMVSALLAMTGIGLLSLNGDLAMNIGDILTLISGFGYAVHLICIGKYTQEEDPVILTLLQIIVAAVISWGLAFASGYQFPLQVMKLDMAGSMIYLGVFSTMIAFLLQNVGQKYTSPSTSALLLSTESVFGAVFSVIFLQEYFTLKMVIGCILIFIAVIMAETKFEFLTGFKNFNKKQKERYREIV